MLHPQDLQTAIVYQLRAIPDLAEFIGDIAEIQAYDDESQISGNPELAEFSMMGRAVMVIWTGAELPRAGDTRGWKHTFKLALKAESITAYYELAKMIFDGVPELPSFDTVPGDLDDTPGNFDDGGGNIDGDNSFLNCVIHPGCDGIQDALIEPERSADGVGRLTITFSLYER